MPRLPKLELPHRLVNSLVRTFVDVGESISNQITSVFDKGPLGPDGPQRFVNDLVTGLGNAVESVSDGITRALDTPVEEVEGLTKKIGGGI